MKIPCTDTCSSLGYQCGTQTICGSSVNCETCSTGFTCNSTGQCTPLPAGTIYYVSTSGSDSNNGLTQSTPWKTLAYAETHATTPGSTIALKRGDTFTVTLANSGRLIITQTGAAGNPIIWDGNLWGTGAKATISASGFYDGIPVIDIPDSRYLTIQNIIFQGQNNDGSVIIIGGYWSGVAQGGGDHERAQNDITIQDCEFYNLGTQSGGDSVYAILVSPYKYNYENITIQRNYIKGVAQCGIGIYSGRTDLGATPMRVKNVYVGYNEVYNFSINPTGEAYLINNGVENVILEHNIANYGSNTHQGLGIVLGANEPSALGYYPKNITIRYNDIKTKDEPALYIQGGQAQSAVIYYNKFYRHTYESALGKPVVMMMDELGRGYSGANFDFYNNVVVTNHADTYCFGHLASGSSIWDIKNNIFISTTSPAAAAAVFFSVGSISTHSNNLYYAPGTNPNYASINGNTYTKSTITSWESTAKSADPLLVNLAGFDWHLQSGSPAVNAGVAIPGLTKDYDGNTISGLPDIGAYEYL
jgi:hypothetical protein